ncbi:MAG: adenosine deaminase [Betaproteobacteria bacterium]|nr:adenosine deaminase [Betaproteobacteria bacterium]
MPKAELHVHIEGTLEPELVMALARRNGVALPYPSAEALRAACRFRDLQSFLDLYYACASVLRTEQDFYDLMVAYLRRAAADGVVHAEIFFDPQTHTARGVRFETVLYGLRRGLEEGGRALGLSGRLILCFLRHLGQVEAFAALAQAEPHLDAIDGFGLDSSELGHPPSGFAEVFARVRSLGRPAVAHAGEEGPPAYIWEALDILKVRRIDHGVRALEDPALVRRLAASRIPLTVCPLSNVRLRVFPEMAAHNLPALLRAGLCVTINSDDPAYFGGYLNDNIRAVAGALRLSAADWYTLARNSFEAAWAGEAQRAAWIRALDAHFARQGYPGAGSA